MDDTQTSTLPADSPWWARWMVANWKECYKWLSVQLPVICAVGCEIYAQYGDQLLAYVPKEWRPHIAAGVFIVSAIVRVVRQPKKEIQP